MKEFIVTLRKANFAYLARVLRERNNALDAARESERDANAAYSEETIRRIDKGLDELNRVLLALERAV